MAPNAAPLRNANTPVAPPPRSCSIVWFSFLAIAFTHDACGGPDTGHERGHVRQQCAARSSHDIVDLLNRLTDFTHGMKQDRRVLCTVPHLVSQGIEIAAHAT